jgi:hypothetical protein
MYLLILIDWLKIDDLKTYVIGAALTIISVFLSNKSLKDKDEETSIKKIFPRYFRKPIFKAEIVNPKTYIRGRDSITFRSRYTGKIKNGYFMNEIFVPLREPKYQHLYTFTNLTPNICNNGLSAKSYCVSTISNTADKSGNLNNWIKTNWICWEWDNLMMPL